MAHKKFRTSGEFDKGSRTLIYFDVKGKCGKPIASYTDKEELTRAFYDFNNTGVLLDSDDNAFHGAMITGKSEDVDDTMKKLGLEDHFIGGSE